MLSRCLPLRPVVIPLLAALMIVSGCDAPAPEEPPAAVAALQEPSWTDQLNAVRSGTATEIRVTATPVSPDELAMLAEGCEALEILDIESIEPAPEDLAVLNSLPALRRLRLGFEVDDAMLRQLSTLPSLQFLNLPNGTFSDEGLSALVELPHLELLRFRSPNVTDAGLPTIAAMPALRFLHLIDVPVTDEGIAALHGMTQLESLYIDGGRCTDDGLRALLEALPDLHFHRDQLHLPDDPHRHPHD